MHRRVTETGTKRRGEEREREDCNIGEVGRFERGGPTGVRVRYGGNEEDELER